MSVLASVIRAQEIFLEDPRLASLQLDLTEYRRALADEEDPTIVVKPDVLRRAGINTRNFDLI